MPMLSQLGDPARYRFVARYGLDPGDAGRLDVATSPVEQTGFYVDVETGDARFLERGADLPPGVWIARQEIEAIMPLDASDADEQHGFGEGWGRQGAQLGGDRADPEEDAGGTIRAPARGEGGSATHRAGGR